MLLLSIFLVSFFLKRFYLNEQHLISKSFVGIFTTYDKIQRRRYIRECYNSKLDLNVDLRFIIGKAKDSEEEIKLQDEQIEFGDLVILDIDENMNNGKTFEFFRFASQLKGYDFISKADDDVYIHLTNFMQRLDDIKMGLGYKFKGVYFGRKLELYKHTFMTGMLYTLSFDLVTTIANDDFAMDNKEGE